MLWKCRSSKNRRKHGLGADKDNPKGIEAAVNELTLITGQKPVITKAKKSIANFKLRAGMNVGAKVTLRGDRMFYFADKLMNIVLPRVRDFAGVSPNSFDGRGNYSIGLKEQLIFPKSIMTMLKRFAAWILFS